VSRAWRRLFGGSIPRGSDRSWVRSVDQGDAETSVDSHGRVLCSSYPGENEIGVLRRSVAAVCIPRLVISGGQTGADRGALDAALELKVSAGGWAPKGWRSEDGEIRQIYRSVMQESYTADYFDRTSRNVEDSDGTLILSLGAELTGGSLATERCAERQRKPHLHVALAVSGSDAADAVDSVVSWIEEHRIGSLNVAGPRESKEPGIQAAVHAFVARVLRRRLQVVSIPVEDLVLGGMASRRPTSTSDIVRLVDWFEPVALSKISAVEVVSREPARASLAKTAPAVPSTGSFRWSPGQEAAIDLVSHWMAGRARDDGWVPGTSQVFRLFGYAGTGKTTLVRELVTSERKTWLYAAYTGKAALIMRQKGCTGAQTIHSLIYRPDGDAVEDDNGWAMPRFKLWDESPMLLDDVAGVVIDECSMVDEEVGRDLLSFGKKILVGGDPEQLPPIFGGGFFTSGAPDALLTEVHRQARESGILDLATHVREGRQLVERAGWKHHTVTEGEAGSEIDCEVMQRPGSGDPKLMAVLWGKMTAAGQVICGTNRTRHQLNDRLRRMMGQSSPVPVSGDRVICLRNERRKGLLNGSQWLVRRAFASQDQRTVSMVIDSDDGSAAGVEVKSWAHHFRGEERQLDSMGPVRMAYQEFDFAYAITCHKAQGSQWDDVVLYDESGVFDDDTARRWLYTGITRAARRLTVVL